MFHPTYLYIKQHSITGKLYFGKTSRNPETYKGSGKRWLNHINYHGKEHVVTLWYCLFYDQESCTEFALSFSNQQNIVESDDWLNLQNENGLDGSPIGCSHPMPLRGSMPEETKLKIGNANRGKIRTNDHKDKISTSHKQLLWWNNGETSIKSKTQPASDFIPGRLSFKRKNKFGSESLNHKSITIDGITFNTMQDAAKHFGKCAATITYWLKSGRATRPS